MEEKRCGTCMMKDYCGWAGATLGQAESGGLSSDGQQIRLDEVNMKLFLERDEELIANGECLFPEGLEEAVKKVKQLYGFE